MYLTSLILLALSTIPSAYADFQIITAQPLPTLALPPVFQNDAEVRLFPHHLYHFPFHLPSAPHHLLPSPTPSHFLIPFPHPSQLTPSTEQQLARPQSPRNAVSPQHNPGLQPLPTLVSLRPTQRLPSNGNILHPLHCKSHRLGQGYCVHHGARMVRGHFPAWTRHTLCLVDAARCRPR
jgi:hypothetical protein